MNISCIALNPNLIQSKNQNKIINYLNTKLYEIGEKFSLISYFDNSTDRIKNIIDEKYDLTFFIGLSSSIYNHNIKDSLSRIFNDKLVNFENVNSTLKKYCANHNSVFSVQEEMEAMLPSKSIPLYSINYFNNGFMYKYGNTYIVFLPDDLDFAKENYTNYILPLINDIANISQDYQVFKCYGILEKDIKTILNDYFLDKDISIQIMSQDLDNTIYIRYNQDIDNAKLQDIISNICSKLQKFIYSTEDISLYQTACDLLKLQNKSLIIGETITFGNITKKLSLIDNEIVKNSYIFNNYDSILNITEIEKRVVDKFGKYSVNTVYELANCLLEKSNADISIFILGDLNNSQSFMAIGDSEGIHVYKNKIQSTGDDLIENLSQTAIFYLIKKLKQNDLHFI